MILCGRGECIYVAVQDMIDKMKEEVAKRQVVSSEQIVVAKIYDITTAILAEACRRNFRIDKKDCEPSIQFQSEKLTLDSFIFLNQLQEDGFIRKEYKKILIDSLIKIKPEIKKLVEEDLSSGLI